MRLHKSWMTGIACVALLIAGCGKSGDAGSSKATSDNAAGQAKSDATSAEAGPGEVVSQFLEAVRTGSDEKAMSMLSPVARQKAAEGNRSPTPPPSDTAKFTIGDIEYVGKDGARVNSTWTDLDENGQPRSDRAIWVCRREAEGWRVAGVAAIVFEGEAPLLLNFEDPEEMAKKQEWLRDEIVRRSKPEATTQKAEKNDKNAVRR